MSAVARMAVLDLRTVAPYRYQGLVVFAVCVAVLAGNRPVVLVPALVLVLTSQVAAYPFLVADKARPGDPVRRPAAGVGHDGRHPAAPDHRDVRVDPGLAPGCPGSRPGRDHGVRGRGDVRGPQAYAALRSGGPSLG